ncbi:AbrB/MazE/SpoVT family DNA-binding domain-containing protein [Saccharopolyspora sp. NPDC002376]
MRVLGWIPGDRVDVAMTSGVVVVRRNRYGAFRLTRRGHLQLPLAVRRWCGVSPGDRVLLAAAPDLGLLVVHTMSVLDGMVVAYHTTLARRDQS